MVRAIIESYMGPLFVQVSRFYEANSLLINSVVVLYGLVIVLSWASLYNIKRRLVSVMVHQMLARPDITPQTKVKRVLKEVDIPWAAVVEQMRFPFVAQQAALLPQRKSVEAVKAHLTPEELAKEALDTLHKLREKDAAPNKE